MTTTAFHSSPIKDGRRILSEKSTNACRSPASTTSPVKRSLVGKSFSPRKQLLPSPSFVAQKRSINQLDDRAQENSGPLHAHPVDSQTEITTDLSLHDAAPTTAMEHTPAHDAMDSEYQLEHQRPRNLSPSHQTPSNQKQARTTDIPSDPESRKLFIQQKATLLRNRLQNAMRHVQDPQFDRRLSELEAHSRKYPRLSLSNTYPRDHMNRDEQQKQQQQQEGEQQLEQEEVGESSAFVTPRAAAPTTQSAEHDAYIHNEDDDPMKTPTQKSHTQSQLQSCHTRTNTSESVAVSRPGSPMQLSSPPPTEHISTLDEPQEQQDENSGQTVEQEGDSSSTNQTSTPTETSQHMPPSQQGDAVDGLLKLMNTGENSDMRTG